MTLQERFWPQDVSKAQLATDMSCNYSYKFTVGMPCELLPQIFAECARIGRVVHLWAFGVIVRVGAAEVRILHSVHGS